MKKVLIGLMASILLILSFALCACGENETYYPTLDEMQSNLAQNGYRVEFAVGERNPEGGGYVVDSLFATKGDDYICFYWIEDAAHCNVYYDKLQELYPDCPKRALIENDEKFGNLVYGGTEKAIDDAGIIVVNVKVTV